MDAVLRLPQDRFPIGTTVGAYPATAWPTGRAADAAPNGAALESKSVQADGTTTFTTLSAGDYFAAFNAGGGVYRRVGFKLGSTADVPGDAIDPGQIPNGSIGSAKLDPVFSAAIKGFVNHGATAGTTRPTGFVSVEWQGSVTPTNAVNGDTWVDTTT